jgi:hypothetical protein
MDPSHPDKILEEWESVANQARRPSAPPRGVTVRGGGSGGTLAGAGLLIAAVLIAAVWLGRQGPGPSGVVGGSPSVVVDPSVTPASTPVATPAAAPVSTPSVAPAIPATQTPPPKPAPTPTATLACEPAHLAARITMWEGAAGSRIADVELTNAGSARCTVRAMDKPQLVDGNGSVLINGTNPPASALLTVAPGGVLTTQVGASNYCGPTPVAPVSVAFVLSGGSRVEATPVSPTDVNGVPPCNGSPGSAGTITMHPWAR